MKLESIVTMNDIETQRIVADFISWFEEILARIRIESDAELREQVLMRSELAKIFYEELFPIYRLMQIKVAEWSDVAVVPVVGNQNHDARIVCQIPRPSGLPDFLEVTCVIDGKDNKFRMRHLVEHGFTRMTGSVTVKQEGGVRKIEIDEDMQSCDEAVERVRLLLLKGIKSKVAKGYPNNTALILFVESHGTFRDAQYRFVLQDVVESQKAELLRTFSSVFLFTSMEGFLKEYRR